MIPSNDFNDGKTFIGRSFWPLSPPTLRCVRLGKSCGETLRGQSAGVDRLVITVRFSKFGNWDESDTNDGSL
jgi:hypothetical protein